MLRKSQSKNALLKISRRRTAGRKSLKEFLQEDKLMERMTKDHLDVLQNIEFAIVRRYRQDSGIDDGIVAEALKGAMGNGLPQDERAVSINETLQAMRELRSDVSDSVWRAGLQTVLDSVRRHSDLKPGRTEYLDFVCEFVV
jgi:hypothetical protein